MPAEGWLPVGTQRRRFARRKLLGEQRSQRQQLDGCARLQDLGRHQGVRPALPRLKGHTVNMPVARLWPVHQDGNYIDDNSKVGYILAETRQPRKHTC